MPIITHKLSRTLTWNSWSMMMQRCFNPKRQDYPRYGARGIKPCGFIKATPANVILIIGERPDKSLSLDRIDNSCGYTCGSCEECIGHGWDLNIRWATPSQQGRNKRNNRYFTINGQTKLADDWSKELGIGVSAIRQRYIYRAKETHESTKN